MRIIVIGATGTIGAAVVRALGARHEVIGITRHGTPRVDIREPATLAAMFAAVRDVDAVVSCAGGGAWKPLAQLTDEDFTVTLNDKLMGQVHVVRAALQHVRDRGSITVTSGVLAQQPMPGSAAISLVNAGLEGFVRAAALEAPRGIRVNVVSPPWVTETVLKLGMDPAIGLPAEVVARSYVDAIEGEQTAETIYPGG